MAEIRAFRGYRYDLGRVGALSDVVAPPYDVIDTPLQSSLYERSPYNVIRLDLNREQPSDTEHENRYTRAGRLLREWLHEKILTQDSARALYVYHQEFEADGRRYIRRGILARVRLEPFGAGRIYPHEETMPGPKADRLSLMHATHMNLSPVFGLFPDPEGVIQAQLDAAVGRALPLEATDHLGVVSRLWPVTDQRVISAVTGMMGPKPIFIADGHHRYETSLKYLEERRRLGEARDDEAAAQFVLMMLVGMSDPGLLILPTHRLASGLPDLTAAEIEGLLGNHFQLHQVGTGASGARAAWDEIEADGSQALLSFGTVADGVWQIACFRAPEAMQAMAPEHSPAWRELAVAVLHQLVFGRLVKERYGVEPNCRFVHLLQEVSEAFSRRESQLAVLVPPAQMHHVEQIAGGVERMPPKSTYFYPKLLTGLVFNPLTGN